MLSFRNIQTVSKYEVKTLFRSWFFRIFSILVFAILTFLSVLIFTPSLDASPWMFRGLPGSIAYFSMLLLNIAQAIIAIFLASDFLKRDRKTNTTEVVYMRSMTNAEYFFGKLMGLIWVFVGLNMLVLVTELIISAAWSDMPFQFLPFLWYFLIISLPTLVFMFGFTFFIMSLVKNQAVTFILLLGYVALCLFFLQDKALGIFDSTGFFMPFAMSNFVGFSNISAILMQRIAYFLLGIGFIFASILLFKRLPQSKSVQATSAIFAAILIATAVTLFVKYYLDFYDRENYRADIRELNDQYITEPVFTIAQHNITFQHKADAMHSTSEMVFVNDNQQSLDHAILSINPKLNIESLKIQGTETEFERELHLLTFQTPVVNSGDSIQVELVYGGFLDDRICYADISDDEHLNNPGILFYRIPRTFYFLQPNYVLLTREVLWYPIAGTTIGNKLAVKPRKQFTKFDLTVSTGAKLTAISQGNVDAENGSFHFTPETPLPQISLVIGDYEKRSVTVEDVEYSLFIKPEHTFYLESVEGLGDSLSVLIREEKDNYEAGLDIHYPFKRFSLVETPTQFIGFMRPLCFASQNVQPEQVLVHERATLMNSADFAMTMRFSDRRMSDRNMEQSETEKKFSALQRFIRGDLFATQGGPNFGATQNIPEENYTIFANYFDFLNGIEAENNSLLNNAMEAYIKDRLSSTGFNFFRRFREGITDDEQANLALRDSSMTEILNNTKSSEKANAVLRVKSIQLFKQIESEIGTEKLDAFFAGFIQKNRFQIPKAEELIDAINANFNVDFENDLSLWSSSIGVPSFLFADFENYEIIDNNRSKYQIKFKIYNNSDIDGLVTIDFMVRGRRGFGPPGGGPFGGPSTDSGYEEVVMIPAGKTLLYARVLDDQPRAVTLNTMLSKNLPTTNSNNFEEFEKRPRMKPVEQKKIVDTPPIFQLQGEFIVDNESEGFTVHSVVEQSPLRRLLKLSEENEEYQPLRPWGGPSNWSKTVNDDFYGDVVKSAHFIRSGDGSKIVSWTAELPQAGKYDVYIYNPQLPFGRGPGRRGRGDNFVQDRHIKIMHDDGVEEVELNSESETGWNYLGEFYFSQGPVKMEMSDKTEGRIVIADAVKWVKK